MKIMNLFLMLVLLFSTSAQAHSDTCRKKNVLCIIDVYNDERCLYYRLQTSEELIHQILMTCSGEVEKDEYKVALDKLNSQGQQLVNAGVCKVLLNNIE